MAILEILTAPDPRLRVKTKPVEKVTSSIVKLMDDMLETMYEAPGIGLAGPQVGSDLSLLVIDITRDEEEKDPYFIINPEIIWTSEEQNTYEEGCLSVPSFYETVIRPKKIKVRYMDREGKTQELEADGTLATVIQHEMDHLNGKLFIDHISALKRNIILRKLKKTKKEELKD